MKNDNKQTELNQFLPGNAEINVLAMRDGMRLRVGYFPAKGRAVASVLLVNGHREFMEKYKEFIEDFQKRGFNVFSYDHRGQGGSDRLLENKLKSHNPDFDAIIDDMHEVVVRFVLPKKGDMPLHLIAHSMGAQFAIRYLHDNNEIFDRAVLMAPFTNFNIGGKLFTSLTKAYTKIANLLGFSKFFAPGQARHKDMIDHEYAFERLTHDRKRYDWSQKVLDALPELFIGGVTFGWIGGVMKSMEVIQKPGYTKKIKTPVLALLADDERVVDNISTIELVEKMPDSIIKKVKGSRHELYREVDSIRKGVIADITVFLLLGMDESNKSKVYKVKLDGKVIGATRFESGDPTRGCVAGALLEYDKTLNYKFFVKLINSGVFVHVDHEHTGKFINANARDRFTVHLEDGSQVIGINGIHFISYDDKHFIVTLLGINFPFYAEEFPAHCKTYIDELKTNSDNKKY